VTPTLEHLLEALRAHRLRVGVGRVPQALVSLEAELLTALSGTGRLVRPVGPAVGHGERVLLTTDETATLLALSPRKVRGLRAAGRLPAVVIDGSVRFRVDDLSNFIDSNKETT